MWTANEKKREQKAALAGGGYVEPGRKKENGKLSCAMAMILGAIVTVEIMIAGAMIFNFDFRGADGIALLFAFVVLYFGVVAVLTDK
ncbi:MAG: hypothetical protein SPE99_01650 [Blautia sp.]|nr:hypothetical protein [Blautia sp.]